MKKKSKAWLVVVLLIIALAGIGAYSQGFLSLVSADFVAPDWARIGCEVVQNDAPLWYSPINVPSSGTSLWCNVYTRQCSITISVQPCSGTLCLWGDVDVKKCSIDSNNNVVGECTKIATLVKGNSQTFYITPNEKLFAYKKSYSGTDWDSGKVTATGYANRYALATSVGGGKWIEKSGSQGAGCFLPSVDAGKVDNACIYSNPMAFDTWCNYVYDFHPSYGFSVYSHPTYGQVYCAGTSIYTLTQINTGSGTKYLDPTIKPETLPKSLVTTVGKYVGEVECCPNAAINCGDDFKFHREPPPAQCFSDVQCANGGAYAPCGSKKICGASCDSGTCTTHEKAVECSTDADCPIAKPNCDRGTWTCVEGGKPPTCGDGTCNGLENNEAGTVGYCPADCGTQKTEIPWLYIGIIIILISIIAGFGYYIYKKSRKRRRR